MPARARNILDEALQLPAKDRADVAGRLILSLHPQADPDVETAWAQEIDRRLEDFEVRKASSRPWNSIRQSLLRTQRARARRKASPRS